MGKIKCKLCLDIIESKHRHDYVTCKCGKVGIDGGHDYLRVQFPANRSFENSIEILTCKGCKENIDA